ncbi:MAG: P1 family peptidase [Longimicrobiales bacterium]
MTDKAGFDGLRLGHATDVDARTGCTVLLGPFRAACDVRGFATGSREIDALSSQHIVPRVNALLLTGGSAFGLAAADGVVGWLEERDIGYDVGVARVPIVPAAVIFDLRAGRSDRRPDAAMGRAACDDARPWPWAEGRVGAGTGATVGKLLGPEHASPGGFGCWIENGPSYNVLAAAVVNAVGDVLDAGGRVIAGARDAHGRFIDATRRLREEGITGHFGRVTETPPGTNTTLAVVATDAPLTRDALAALARMVGSAMARRISPVNTPFDGDIVFALSTAPAASTVEPGELLALGAAATWTLEQAIERAVTAESPSP